jgi:hypothetical protein
MVQGLLSRNNAQEASLGKMPIRGQHFFEPPLFHDHH